MAFITFEGIEGCGKSTHARLLAERLGPDTVLTKEPGGTRLGRGVRGLLLDPSYGNMTPVAESLLYFADRAQHVAEVLRPALDAGRTVVSDRFTDSSIAYQGYGRGLPLALIRTLAEAATGGLRPDLILFLDVSIEIGLHRVGRRGERDRLEAEERAFHERVRDGYRRLMEEEPDRWVVLDAEGGVQDVQRRVVEAVARRNLGGAAGLS